MLALLIAATTAWSAAAGAKTPPAAGRFLVATLRQQGFFAKTVILLLDYGADGALGIVVNRPTKLTLAEVLTNPGLLHGRTDRVYLGGPVGLDKLTMLIHSRSAPPQSSHVVDGVYASDSLRALRAAVRRKLSAANFRAYAGYAGWAPGQLDSELAQGAWIVVPAGAGDIFTTAPGKLWDKLNPQGKLILVKLTPAQARFRNRRPGTQPPNSVRRNSMASGQARSAAAGA